MKVWEWGYEFRENSRGRSEEGMIRIEVMIHEKN